MSETYNIYFNENKEAFAFEIENPICIVTSDIWGQYAGTDKWDIIDGVFIDISDTPEYQEKEASARRQDFESKFFEIKNFGWYRREPKGYSSAIESINNAYNSFNEMRKLGLTENFPANTLIFYQQPDFTKPEQCTEEWLVAHQIFNQEMTPEQFGQFYIGFSQAWNTQEHEQSETK